jgi:hypothetical protein
VIRIEPQVPLLSTFTGALAWDKKGVAMLLVCIITEKEIEEEKKEEKA